MAFIESHQTLARHPKTRKLARLLSVSVPAAIGHLHCLWYWAMDYAQDGDLTAHDLDEIAYAAMWEGDPNVFLDALVQSHFVDRDTSEATFHDREKDATLYLHEWMDYAGRLIEKRKSDAARKRSSRLGLTGQETQPSIKEHVPQTSTGHPPDGAGTVPNPTVPNPTVPNRDTGGAPQAETPPPAKARPQRIRADFAPSEADREWAAEKVPGLDLEWATEEFVNYWRGAGKPMLDWSATWRNGMQKAYERAPRSSALAIANGRASPDPPRVLTAYERRVQERGAAK